MKTDMIKRIIKENSRQYGMIVALIAIVLLFYMMTGGLLLSPLNVTNIVLQNSYVLILAIGMLPVILIGKFDLSVGSLAGFVGAVAAILIFRYQMSFVPVLFIGLLVGAVVGALQGACIAYIGIPAFVCTLSTMLMFRGLTMIVLDGRSIGPFSDEFRSLSSSFLPDFFKSDGLHLTTILIGILLCLIVVFNALQKRKSRQKYNFEVLPLGFDLAGIAIACIGILILTYFFSAYKGIPTVMILVAILIVVYTFITNNTVIGRRLYALGGNERAAALSGIRTKLLTLLAFLNLGVMAAFAGLVFAARLNAGTPKAGNGFEMDAIASCFIGGASASGGIGTIIGAIVGALIMGVINNGMSIMGIAIDMQQVIKGFVLLAAVAFDVVSKARK